MSVVAIVGVSGCLGSNLANQYAVDDETERIVGIDRRPFRDPPPKMVFHQGDVARSPADLFREHGVGTAIYLAGIVDPIHDERSMDRVNIEGAERFLEACGEAGVSVVGIASSTLAYGARPDNPPELYEGHPLRGDPSFHLARAAQAVERACQAFAKRYPETVLQVYRTASVIGPTVDNFFTRFLLGDSLTCLKGFSPCFQFIHEDDVTLILFRLLKARAIGIFNVAADGVVPLTEAAHLLKRRLRPVSESVLRYWMKLGWTLRLRAMSSLPPTMLDYLKYDCIASNRKVKRDLGYRFKYSSKGALLDFIERRAAIGG